MSEQLGRRGEPDTQNLEAVRKHQKATECFLGGGWLVLKRSLWLPCGRWRGSAGSGGSCVQGRCGGAAARPLRVNVAVKEQGRGGGVWGGGGAGRPVGGRAHDIREAMMLTGW